MDIIAEENGLFSSSTVGHSCARSRREDVGVDGGYTKCRLGFMSSMREGYGNKIAPVKGNELGFGQILKALSRVSGGVLSVETRLFSLPNLNQVL